MLKNQNAQELFQQYYFPMHNRFPVTFINGKGCKLYDDNGLEYLDALGGIAVNSLGHCHPAHVKAIQEQAATLIHVSNFYYNLPQSQLAQKLNDISGFDRAFFCNSGLEANEGAIKLARKYAGQKGKTGKIYSFTGCFHGRSLATVAMGKKVYQEGFEPMPSGFEMLNYNDVGALSAISENDVAVFIEFIQGEGGVNPANRDFIDKLVTICREKNVLLIADEIQTGIGRTGKWFGFQHYQAKPDIVTLAKGLAGGFPIGAVLADEDIAVTFKPGNHSTTFGGNPLACATALATLNTIESELLVENVFESGKYLKDKLMERFSGKAAVKEIRGLGLLVGIEFNFPCGDLVKKIFQNKLLVSCTAGNVIRLAPPLIVSRGEIDKIVNIIDKSVEELTINVNY